MKQQMMKHVTRPEFLRVFNAFVEGCGSQVAAAEKLGVSQVLVHKVATGRIRPGPKIVRHFGLTTENVIVRLNDKPTDSTGNDQ